MHATNRLMIRWTLFSEVCGMVVVRFAESAGRFWMLALRHGSGCTCFDPMRRQPSDFERKVIVDAGGIATLHGSFGRLSIPFRARWVCPADGTNVLLGARARAGAGCRYSRPAGAVTAINSRVRGMNKQRDGVAGCDTYFHRLEWPFRNPNDWGSKRRGHVVGHGNSPRRPRRVLAYGGPEISVMNKREGGRLFFGGRRGYKITAKRKEQGNESLGSRQ